MIRFPRLRCWLRRLLILFVVLALGVGVTAFALREPTDRVESLREGPPPLPAGHEWTSLDRVSPIAVCAIIVAEDKSFFRHRGINWIQTGLAAAMAVGSREAKRGGSTLTQQLARTLFLSPERTLRRKAREAVIARQLERALSKQRILEIYVNLVPYAPDVRGIVRAAQAFFGKSPDRLDALEGAFLASQLQAPDRALEGRNLARSLWEQQRILHRLYLNGAIDRAEWSAALLRVSAAHRDADPSALSALDRVVQAGAVPGERVMSAADRNMIGGLAAGVALRPDGAVIERSALLAAECGTDRGHKVAPLAAGVSR